MRCFCRELTKSTRFITLAFVDPDLEKAYYQHTESFSSVTLQAFLIVRLAIGVSQFIVLPRYQQKRFTYLQINQHFSFVCRRLMSFLSFVIGNVVLMMISIISLAEVISMVCIVWLVCADDGFFVLQSFCGALEKCCQAINDSTWMRRVLSTICIVLLATVNVIDTVIVFTFTASY